MKITRFGLGLCCLTSAFGLAQAFSIPQPLWVGAFFLVAAITSLAAFFVIGKVSDRSGVTDTRDAQIAKLKAEIDRQKDSLDELADGLDVGIFVTDSKLNILYANRSACETFAFLDPSGLSVLAVTLSNELETIIKQALEKKETKMAEVTIRHPQERIFYASCWAETSGDRLFLSLYDITDLRRLERVRKDFVANVSHELRTPMATIRAMAETILDKPENLDPDQTQYLHKIIKDVDRLTNITDDLLVLSLSESGGMSLISTNVSEVVQGAIHDLGPRAEAKGLTIKSNITEGLEAVVNPTQFAQIATNLISNAIIYAQSGEIEVTLSATKETLSLKVSDNGIGIAEDHLSRVFERFYRVDKGRSSASGGTGLGLAIVRHIAESHGGRVSVESKLNQGSVFTVEIPLHINAFQ